MQAFLQQLLLGTALPAGVAALCLLPLARARWRTPRVAGLLGVLALCAGYAAAHGAIAGWPGANNADRTHSGLLLLPLLSLLGLGEALAGRDALVRWIPRLFLGVAAIAWLSESALAYSWEGAEATRWLAGLGAGLLLLFLGLDALACRFDGVLTEPPEALMLALLSAAVGGSAGVMMLAGSAKLAALGGALAAALGPLLLLTWWAPEVRLLGGILPVLAFLWSLLLGNALLYADLPPSGAALLVLSPGAAWLSRGWPLEGLRGWKALAASLVVVGALVGGAAALAQAAAPPPLDYGGYGSYGS